jgi:hypothetical protein
MHGLCEYYTLLCYSDDALFHIPKSFYTDTKLISMTDHPLLVALLSTLSHPGQPLELVS